MTAPGPYFAAVPDPYASPPAPVPARPAWVTRADLRFAALIVATDAVLGVLLGAIWALWSPPGPLGLIISPGVIQPDETEAFVAADGRYAILAVIAGMVTAGAAWSVRRYRGPVAGVALGVGGIAGGLIMVGIGRLAGGGSDHGKPNTLLRQLPLALHTHGFLFLQAMTALLVYAMAAAFAPHDDLRAADPDDSDALGGSDAVGGSDAAGGSVAVGGQLKHGWGDGDAAGRLQ